MSLIGKQPIIIKDQVTVSIDRGTITVKGPKGELKQTLPLDDVKVSVEEKQVLVTRKSDSKQAKSFHGLVRSLIQNMVTGVTDGYQKRLELVGTGYRVAKQGAKLVLSLGFSHPVEVTAPAGITLDVEGNNAIIIKGFDKQAVGQITAEIRAKRPPEPYKGKGIRYEGEQVRRKAGKTTSA